MLYNLGIYLYSFAIFLAQFFNPKAKKLYTGRINTWKILSNFQRNTTKPLVWFHCASLGEFEQARPVIEKLKLERDIQIALSFFSPSGYEVRKDYALADVVFYLPADTYNNAKKVLNHLSPSMVFLVKYEIWINLIKQIYALEIPLYLISATFRPKHIYFKWYGQLFKNTLRKFKLIFTQDEFSATLLKDHHFNNVLVSNDTRYDRVYANCLQVKKLPLIESFVAQELVIVLGSSYLDEERLIANFIHEFKQYKLKVVIAPHQISASRIAQVMQLFTANNPIKYSEATLEQVVQHQVLVIDNIGLLSSIYQYAHIAIIGGGFGNQGIHNTLEAATFGMPILIGPNNHERFPELGLLAHHNVLHTITNQPEFNQLLISLIENTAKRNDIKQRAKLFIQNNIGATDFIFTHLGNL